MRNLFKKLYILGALLILLISMVFVVQYTYTNNIIIKSKESSIEKSGEILRRKINSELNLNSRVIEFTSSMITTNNWSEDEIAKNINKILEENPIFDLLYYGDTKGKLINALNWEAPVDYDLRGRPWYTKALAEKGLIYSETYVDARTGDLAITMAKPVYDSNNQIQGVVAGDVLINEIINLVESSKHNVYGEGEGYSFLIDGKGNILAHPDYTYDDYSNLKSIDEISPGLSHEMRINKQGKKPVIIDAVDGYLFYQPIKNTDWVIGSFATMKEYNAKSKYLFRTLAVALLAALLIFVIFLILQNRYFIRPLKSLVNDIEAIDITKDIGHRILTNEKDPFIAPRESINKIMKGAEYFFRQQQEYGEELMASHEELEAQNIQLHHLSYYDHLTKIYNRRSFEKQIILADEKGNLPLGIIMADVNGLKLVNDSFGHKVGDDLLKETGNILREACSKDQLVFRMGGDEFIIILPRTNLEEAQDLIKTIRVLGREVSLHNIKLSISFGVAIKENIFEDISDTIKKAEDDMYSNKLLEGPSMRSKTIDTIIQTLYEKNSREEAHSTRVSTICKEMGIKLGMTDDEIKQLETVGLVHDIGKIAVSNNILDKPNSLDDDEWKEMQRHPEIGYRILRTTSEMAQIAEYALSHHERYDGRGYPQGLAGEEIPLVSRIITIADAYDAMVSDRPYRKGLPVEIAIEEIIKNAGTQFDPVLAKIFVEDLLLNNNTKNPHYI